MQENKAAPQDFPFFFYLVQGQKKSWLESNAFCQVFSALGYILKMLLSSQQNITFGFLSNIQQEALWPPRDQIKKLLFPEGKLNLVLDHTKLKNSQIKQEFQNVKTKVSLDPGFISALSARPCTFWCKSFHFLWSTPISIQLEIRSIWPGVTLNKSTKRALFPLVKSSVKIPALVEGRIIPQARLSFPCQRRNPANSGSTSSSPS